LMVVPRSHSPMAFGVFHPAILLPQTLPERLSPAEVETILEHE
jgi:beta-lactamase regulating signal transducer with metallopeptidase domain